MIRQDSKVKSVQQFDFVDAIHKLKARVHTVDCPDHIPTSFSLWLAQDVFDTALENVSVDLSAAVQALMSKQNLFLPGTLTASLSVEKSLEDICDPTVKCNLKGEPLDTRIFNIGKLSYGAKRDVNFKLTLSSEQKGPKQAFGDSNDVSRNDMKCVECAPPRREEEHSDEVDMCKICLEDNCPRQFSCTRPGSNCNFAMCPDCFSEEIFFIIFSIF